VTGGTYFEDVVVDKVQVTPAITVTETHVALYEGLTSDAPAGAGGVPDVLPLCMVIGLGWRVKDPPLVVVAFVGLDWQIMRELRVGDTVHSRSRILSKRPMRDGGLVVDERTVVDQHGEIVQQGKFTFLVAKRPKEVPA
jgi:acyl dehydratase